MDRIKNKLSFWRQVRNYLLIYLAFAFSVTSFFLADRYKWLFFTLFLLVFFIFRREKINKILIFSILYLTYIFVSQLLSFGEGKVSTFISIIAFIVFIPYAILQYVGINFKTYYINILLFFSIISLVFWLASTLSPQFYEFTSTIPWNYKTDLYPENYKQFIIYTYEPARIGEITRNPGPTWEPGGFAEFLILALILNMLDSKRFFNLKNVIFIITILTTFSTGAYLGLMIIFIYKIMSANIHTVYKFLFVPFTLLFLFILFTNISFLKDKIEDQIREQSTTKLNSTTTGRFYAFRKSILVISKYPLTGRGLLSATNAKEYSEENLAYGFYSWAARIGIIGFLFYYYLMYKSLVLYNKIYKTQRIYFPLFAFIAILIQQFNEMGVSSVIFFMLIFISPLYGHLAKPEIRTEKLHYNELQ